MLPIQVQIIPQYIVFSKLGWVNTYLPLIIPHLFGTSFFIFMMVQFIRGIPIELDEAAEIDGCSKWGIFFRIILPLIKPALLTAAIFAFYWTWDDFLAPLIYLNASRLYTLSLALRSFADPASVTNWGQSSRWEPWVIASFPHIHCVSKVPCRRDQHDGTQRMNTQCHGPLSSKAMPVTF